MPQSLANVLLHVVFSTKNRAPFLKDKTLREQLNAYMVGTLQGISCPSLIIRTVDDHLHGLANQEEHHRRLSFQDEFRALLERHEIEYDERYVWD